MTCSKCGSTKEVNLFRKGTNICYDCNNNIRREKYKNDPEHRQKKERKV